MKIILLPGMDGTGLLFKPLLSLLPFPYQIISFPSSQPQTYESIYEHIKSCLPDEEFYVIAESFSGPLAARLAAENPVNLKGVIFVATFLSCPSPSLVRLTRVLPLKSVLKLPLASKLIRKFLVGNEVALELFYSAITDVSESALKSRLSALLELDEYEGEIYSQVPTLYLYAESDWLVSRKHVNEFINGFPNIVVHFLKGTHFLLQSNPQCCANFIRGFIGV